MGSRDNVSSDADETKRALSPDGSFVADADPDKERLMRRYVLPFGAFLLSACLTKQDSTSPPVAGDLWALDSSKSSPKYPDGAFIFELSNDTLHTLNKSRNPIWKANTCYYPDRNIEIARSGDSLVLLNTNDSIWNRPKVFYENGNGELQSDSADTSRFKYFFKRITSYPDCDEIFGKDFQLTLSKASTENELYSNRRFDLELGYPLNGVGYGYSGYDIAIEGGATFLGSYAGHVAYRNYPAIPNQGSITLSIPLDSLYDSLSQNIRIEINLAGHTPTGLEIFYRKKIFYDIR